MPPLAAYLALYPAIASTATVRRWNRTKNQLKANPASMIQSCGMQLQWFGEKRKLGAFEQASQATDKAIDTVFTDPASPTPDPDGKTGTKRFGALVAETVRTACR